MDNQEIDNYSVTSENLDINENDILEIEEDELQLKKALLETCKSMMDDWTFINVNVKKFEDIFGHKFTYYSQETTKKFRSGRFINNIIFISDGKFDIKCVGTKSTSKNDRTYYRVFNKTLKIINKMKIINDNESMKSIETDIIGK